MTGQFIRVLFQWLCAVVDPDIRLGGGVNLICLSASYIYFFVREGAKVYSQTGWGGHGRIPPPPGSATGRMHEPSITAKVLP